MAKRKKLEKNMKKSEERIVGRSTYITLAVLLVLIVIFIVSYNFFSGLNKVKYENLVFFKEKFGEINLYRYTYHFPDNNGKIITYNFYVRTNPAKNNIPVSGSIEFPKGKFVYLAINSTGLTQCPTSRIAIAGLSAFITNNQFKLITGTPDKAEAERDNLTYVSCDIHENNAVINLFAGEETNIYKKDFCYNIEIGNCEILEA